MADYTEHGLAPIKQEGRFVWSRHEYPSYEKALEAYLKEAQATVKDLRNRSLWQRILNR